MRLYHDLMHVHQIIPTPAEAAAMSGQGGWGSGGINWFSSGKAAMIVIGRWYLCQVRNWPEIAPHLAAVRLPRVPGHPSRGMAESRGAGINAKSPHWRESLEFLRYLAGRTYGELIVQDGDSLPPNPELARTGRDLVNEVVPDAAFHQPFVEALQNARPLDLSPFIDAGQVDRWLRERIENVENKVEDPEVALRSLADEINKRIRLNLQRRPDLRRKYEQVTGRPYTPDWWRTHPEP
ncbi:MAG TPA: hypothetical protein VM431_12065 [Phycisphaerae bacterium]|nr:hypothetical protein [Phycisphaerae bacterium]